MREMERDAQRVREEGAACQHRRASAGANLELAMPVVAFARASAVHPNHRHRSPLCHFRLDPARLLRIPDTPSVIRDGLVSVNSSSRQRDGRQGRLSPLVEHKVWVVNLHMVCHIPLLATNERRRGRCHLDRKRALLGLSMPLPTSSGGRPTNVSLRVSALMDAARRVVHFSQSVVLLCRW